MLISLYFYFFNFKIISKKTTLISVIKGLYKNKVENLKVDRPVFSVRLTLPFYDTDLTNRYHNQYKIISTILPEDLSKNSPRTHIVNTIRL